MKNLLAMLLLFSGAAFAQAPQAVQGECVRQMNMGLCIAQNDGSSDPIGSSVLITGAGYVPLSAYRDYTRLANENNPQDVAMCDLAYVKMTTEPGGPHDLVARALWTPHEQEVKQTISEQITQELKTNQTLQKTSIAGLVLMCLGLLGFRKTDHGTIR
jgi:hypothetical protein